MGCVVVGYNQTEGAIPGGHYAVGQEWHPYAAPSAPRVACFAEGIIEGNKKQKEK
jgi:hypothetical protein